jgi:amidophosphoribosyltransferase
MCYAVQGRLFAAASESVALSNLGFTDVRDVEPGTMIHVTPAGVQVKRFARPQQRAHCFFEWVYFSNVASTLDGSSVYMCRARLGQRLAELEDQPIDDDCIVVPVPDTAKATADSMAFHLRAPSMEGLIRNRYVGRTFIQSGSTRKRSASTKYTPLPAVLEGKRVFLVEDSIVRSTTLRALVDRIRSEGRAREVHVRVACPPIVAPCFYGIDMSTLDELFAPEFVGEDYCGEPTPEQFAKMAESLKIDSLRYLNVSDLGECIGLENENLCLGCVTGSYPSCWGNKLMASARRNVGSGKAGRTYE